MTLRFAIQKSGRLREDSIDLIKKLGIHISRNSSFLKFESKNFPVEFLYLRDDDIPGYVEAGVADLGIVGENVLAEKSSSVNTVRELGFAHCKLSVAVPKESTVTCLKDLEGKKIATSYPNILTEYAKEKNINIKTHFISGSVEVAPAINIAPAIFDIVSTGSTLIQNGLKAVETIFKSQAVLIANNDLSKEKNKEYSDFLFRLDAVLQASNYKYVVLNSPKGSIDKVKDLLPGLKSPTISPHSDPNWVSMYSVVKENEFWSVLEQLKEAGAEGIIILPVEKMIL